MYERFGVGGCVSTQGNYYDDVVGGVSRDDEETACVDCNRPGILSASC